MSLDRTIAENEVTDLFSISCTPRQVTILDNRVVLYYICSGFFLSRVELDQHSWDGIAAYSIYLENGKGMSKKLAKRSTLFEILFRIFFGVWKICISYC